MENSYIGSEKSSHTSVMINNISIYHILVRVNLHI